MSETTATNQQRPAAEIDAEVVAFRAQFDQQAPLSPLDQIVRQGAQQMLQAAIEAEVQEFLAVHDAKRDEDGRRQVVRNGHLPTREIMTGAGRLEIKQPRVRDKTPKSKGRVKFSPSIIPRYMRKSPSIDELIPVLYLLGVSTGDFSEALQALVGEQAQGFGPNTVVRLKEKWTEEHQQWSKRSLAGKRYVYVWADGIHVNVRLADEENRRQCILVLMGATPDGRKELIAVQDGYRESEQSWSELLLDAAWSRRPSWPSATEPWASGRPCGKHIPPPGSNAAGSTRRPTSSMTYPRQHSHESSKPCTPSGKRSRVRLPSSRWRTSRRSTRPSTPRPGSDWTRIGTCCWRSMTSRRSTGGTFARPTRSSQPSPRSDFVIDGPKAAARVAPAWR